jgi:hypothetical protein
MYASIFAIDAYRESTGHETFVHTDGAASLTIDVVEEKDDWEEDGEHLLELVARRRYDHSNGISVDRQFILQLTAEELVRMLEIASNGTLFDVLPKDDRRSLCRRLDAAVRLIRSVDQ